jgi:hypothetical protein
MPRSEPGCKPHPASPTLVVDQRSPCPSAGADRRAPGPSSHGGPRTARTREQFIGPVTEVVPNLPARSPFPNHNSGRLQRLPWGYELFDRDPNQELRRTLCARRSQSRSLRVAEAPQRANGSGVDARNGGVLSKLPVETSVGRRVRIRAGRGRGQIIPASPCVGAGLLPPLALRTLPPVRQLEQLPAAASVGDDHNYIERPGARRRIIDVDTRSIGIIEFSPNQGQEAAKRAGCCAPSPS